MQIFPLNLLIELLLLAFIWEYGSYVDYDFMIDLSVTMTGIHLSLSGNTLQACYSSYQLHS